ncbi:MAG TPA: LLM class flavin-dependent oxidoreductase, partial [Vicinamibacterales bacterium]|nr:LLM class flavin-dependent oxidoreductase [Vicinamibacterales bacterium]
GNEGWDDVATYVQEAEHVFFQHIRRGAERAGRSLADLDLQAGGAVEFTDDVDKAVARHRPGIAFTLGAMGSREHNFYNAAFQRAGYEEEARAVQRKWLEGDRRGAAELVPDEMVLKVNMLGTPEMVRQRMQAYRDAGVTTLRLDPRGASLRERLETLGRAVELARSL